MFTRGMVSSKLDNGVAKCRCALCKKADLHKGTNAQRSQRNGFLIKNRVLQNVVLPLCIYKSQLKITGLSSLKVELKLRRDRVFFRNLRL
jgi:hypothetical protein